MPQQQAEGETLRVRLTPVFGGLQVDVNVDKSGEFRIYDFLKGRYLLSVIRGPEVLDVQQVSFDQSIRGAAFVVKLSGNLTPILHVHSN